VTALICDVIHLSGDVTLGELIVGLGTLALAGFTYKLARKTGDEVDLSRIQLELNREAVEAADRPYVLPSPPPKQTGLMLADRGYGYWLTLRLWNVGRGPAVVTDLQLELDREAMLDPLVDERAVASEGDADLRVQVPGLRGDIEEPVQGEMRVYYRQANGLRYMTVSSVEANGSWVFCSNFRRENADDRERPATGRDRD
jgi:hypothetical protein